MSRQQATPPYNPQPAYPFPVDRCRCKRMKRQRNAFCRLCFDMLPFEIQEALRRGDKDCMDRANAWFEKREWNA